VSQVRITSTGPNNGTVLVDGQDLAKLCRGADISISVGHFTTVTLDMVIGRTVEFEGEATVKLTPEVEQALTGLGWTPPDAALD
jgi:hypothetical protein